MALQHFNRVTKAARRASLLLLIMPRFAALSTAYIPEA
jgi:hypothetical protein